MDRFIRLLRAKAAELDNIVLQNTQWNELGAADQLRADISLIASILAEYIEMKEDAAS